MLYDKSRKTRSCSSAPRQKVESSTKDCFPGLDTYIQKYFENLHIKNSCHLNFQGGQVPLVGAPGCHLSTARGISFILSPFIDGQAGKLRIPIFSRRFDPTGNGTRVYRFSSTRSIQWTTDRSSINTPRYEKQKRCQYAP